MKNKQSKSSSQKKRISVDWAKTTRPSVKQIDEICEAHNLTKDHRRELESFLDEIVDYIARWLLPNLNILQREESSLSENIGDAKNHIEHLEMFLQWISKFDEYTAYSLRPGSEWYFKPEARTAFSQAAIEDLSSVLDPWLVMKQFRGVPNYVAIEGDRLESAVLFFDQRQRIVETYLQFNSHKAMLTVLHALRGTLVSFVQKLQEVTPKGGPKPRQVEPWLLMNLAALYERLGRNPTSKTDDDFHEFAKEIVEALGHPTMWIARGLRPAIRAWRRNRGTKLAEK